MEISYFKQQSEEWFIARKACLTASHAQAIGNCGKGLETYVLELMADAYSSGEKDNYTNKDMQRGIELEEQARDMYELKTGHKVEQVGLIKIDDCVICSPDGLIGEDGGIEIKCLNDVNHFSLVLEGEKGIESKYIWQIQMNLFITGRKWWIIIYYNPNFKESLLMYKILPEKEKQEKLKEGLEKGKQLIQEICNKYKK
jgi:predicted phage-related endonuclease